MIYLLIVLVGLLGWWYVERPIGVLRIVDGDNIELVDGRRIRYIGVDAPEEGECFREESIKINEELVMGKKVKIEFDKNDMDNYGRWLAYVWVDDVFVNQELLEKGAGEYFLDTVNKKYGEELVEAAEKGYGGNQGLWGKCGGEVDCVVKGNVDRNDKRWYHLPGFRHYSQTEVNLDHGDRWFCSEEEAIKAGFERARE
jgi:micrococcal nuclease